MPETCRFNVAGMLIPHGCMPHKISSNDRQARLTQPQSYLTFESASFQHKGIPLLALTGRPRDRVLARQIDLVKPLRSLHSSCIFTLSSLLCCRGVLALSFLLSFNSVFKLPRLVLSSIFISLLEAVNKRPYRPSRNLIACVLRNFSSFISSNPSRTLPRPTSSFKYRLMNSRPPRHLSVDERSACRQNSPTTQRYRYGASL
jgi:hypothetical protein